MHQKPTCVCCVSSVCFTENTIPAFLMALCSVFPSNIELRLQCSTKVSTALPQCLILGDQDSANLQKTDSYLAVSGLNCLQQAIPRGALCTACSHWCDAGRDWSKVNQGLAVRMDGELSAQKGSSTIKLNFLLLSKIA